VVLTGGASGAPERAARRRTLDAARLGELRDGVWARPANVEVAVPEEVEALVSVGMLHVDEAGQRSLVERLWDLDGWAGRSRELLARLASLSPDEGEVLAPGFVLSAAVLRHLQADPLLPAELAPTGWPAAELRTAYDPWDRAYRAQLAAWHRTAV
jgi:phenylacetic acid degradation operon negative regulatory protein